MIPTGSTHVRWSRDLFMQMHPETYPGWSASVQTRRQASPVTGAGRGLVGLQRRVEPGETGEDAGRPLRPSGVLRSPRGLHRDPATAIVEADDGSSMPPVPFSGAMDAPSSIQRGLEGPHRGLWPSSGSRSEPGIVRRAPDEFTALARPFHPEEPAATDAPDRDPADHVLATLSRNPNPVVGRAPYGAVGSTARQGDTRLTPPRSAHLEPF